MKKPIPINKEVPFKFDELFFSTTDKRGVIQYGNDVFVNISGYPQETIIGAPHNIIRHPDMPKAVFKLFWQMLKANQPIGAYVKNMALDGSYYWVYAFAFPIAEGYLSIRFKPSSPIFAKVQEIYQAVLEQEKTLNVDESLNYLVKVLEENGFSSYDDFMVQSVVAELKARDQHLSESKSAQDETDPLIRQISEIAKKTSSSLDGSFNKISLFQECSQSLTSNIERLHDEFKKLKFLSINMTTLAHKLGNEAATLAVISKEFSTIAVQIENQMSIFSKFSENLLKVIQKASFELAALKNQMIMVDFFVKESIAAIGFKDNAFEGMIKNRDSFTNLFSESIKRLADELLRLKSELRDLEGQLSDIRKLASGMEIIKQTGAIESARKDEIKKAFSVYLVEMTQFMDVLRNVVQDLNAQRLNLDMNVKEIHESASTIKDNINEVFRLALLKSA